MCNWKIPRLCVFILMCIFILLLSIIFADSDAPVSSSSPQEFMSTGKQSREVDGYVWTPFGFGTHMGHIADFEVYGDGLVAAGYFNRIDYTYINNIAKWNGSSWSSLGSGTNDRIHCMIKYQDKLVIGGEFTSAGGVSVNYIAQWNGSGWSSLGSGMNNMVVDLAVYKNSLYACGNFT